MALINEKKSVSAMSKQFQPELAMSIVTAPTTAILTYYNGYKPKTGTGTDYQLPNRAVGDIVFTTATTTDTVNVTASYDGTNYESAASLATVIFDDATGLPVASVNLASGTYRIPYRVHQAFQTIKFTKNGTASMGGVSVAKIITVP